MLSVLKRSFSSNPVISWRRQPLRNVTFQEFFKASHGQQRIDGSLANGTFPSASTATVVLCGRRFTLFFVPVSVAPYSIISSVINRRFCGVLSNYHFGPGEAEKSIALNTCRPFVGPIPDEGVASSSVRFFLLYIQCSVLIFCLFHLCWLLRETKRETVACYFIFFSFRQHIFHHLTLHQYSGLLSKYLLKVSFHFLTSFICS